MMSFTFLSNSNPSAGNFYTHEYILCARAYKRETVDNRHNNLIHDAFLCSANLWWAVRGRISIKSSSSCHRCVIVKQGPVWRHRRAACCPPRLRVKNRLRLPLPLRAAVTRVNHLHERCIKLMVKVKGGVWAKLETSARLPKLCWHRVRFHKMSRGF